MNAFRSWSSTTPNPRPALCRILRVPRPGPCVFCRDRAGILTSARLSNSLSPRTEKCPPSRRQLECPIACRRPHAEPRSLQPTTDLAGVKQPHPMHLAPPAIAITDLSESFDLANQSPHTLILLRLYQHGPVFPRLPRPRRQIRLPQFYEVENQQSALRQHVRCTPEKLPHTRIAIVVVVVSQRLPHGQDGSHEGIA